MNQNGTQVKNNMYLCTKADASSIKMNVVRKIIKDIGLDLEKLQTEGKLKLPQKEWHRRVGSAVHLRQVPVPGVTLLDYEPSTVSQTYSDVC